MRRRHLGVGLVLLAVLAGGSRANAQSSCPGVFTSGGFVVGWCDVPWSGSGDLTDWGDPITNGETHPLQTDFDQSPGYEEGRRMARETSLRDAPPVAVLPPIAHDVLVQVAIANGLNLRNTAVAIALGEAEVTGTGAGTSVEVRPGGDFVPTFARTQGGNPRPPIGGADLTDGQAAGTDPVDPSSGEFVHSVLDLDLPSAGISFQHRRTYRSRSDGGTELGPGWDHSYHRRVASLQDGALYDTGDGVTLRFDLTGLDVTTDGDGLTRIRFHYVSRAGGTLVLAGEAEELPPSGVFRFSWWITAEDGTIASFDGRGNLRSVVDRNGRGLTLDWGEDGVRAAVPRLVQATRDTMNARTPEEYMAANDRAAREFIGIAADLSLVGGVTRNVVGRVVVAVEGAAARRVLGRAALESVDYCVLAGCRGLGPRTMGVGTPIATSAGGGGGGGRTLYRAVGPDELADIQAAGRYRVPAGGTEGKYFFETPDQASNFARMMGDQPYTTTSVRVSPSQLGRGQPINPAREGPGYFFDTPNVPSGPVTIFNYSVVP